MSNNKSVTHTANETWVMESYRRQPRVWLKLRDFIRAHRGVRAKQFTLNPRVGALDCGVLAFGIGKAPPNLLPYVPLFLRSPGFLRSTGGNMDTTRATSHDDRAAVRAMSRFDHFCEVQDKLVGVVQYRTLII